jgi:hypothetical protein
LFLCSTKRIEVHVSGEVRDDASTPGNLAASALFTLASSVAGAIPPGVLTVGRELFDERHDAMIGRQHDHGPLRADRFADCLEEIAQKAVESQSS